MVMSMNPQEEAQVFRRQVGYSWSYSFEFGVSGNRQKLILAGNTELMARSLTELKAAKVEVYKLALSSIEELQKPQSHDLNKMYNERNKEEEAIH